MDRLNGTFEWGKADGPEHALAQEKRSVETAARLRELVRAWQLSGPHLYEFSRQQRTMWTEVHRYWVEGRKLNPLLLLGAPGGGAGIGMNCRPESDPYKEALRLFIELLLNPECHKLAGPCSRCEKYYVRRSARNKIYCSRSCGTRATALAATRKRRDEEHADKLARAAAAAQEWTVARTNKDWKSCVSRRHPDITVRFLTRALNKGQLKLPTKGKKQP